MRNLRLVSLLLVMGLILTTSSFWGGLSSQNSPTLAGQIPAIKAPVSGGWVFKENRVYNSMTGSVATITSEQYDVSGGSVDVKLSGDILSFCPGGYEEMRFTWKFPTGVQEISNGGTVSVNLDARQKSKTQNCGTQLASRSLMYMYTGSLALQNDSGVDGDRFVRSNGFRVRAADGVNNGIGSVEVNTHPFDPKKPLAYFEVCIGTPTNTASLLCYAYVYEYSGSGGSTSSGSTGSNSGGSSDFTIEYDTDRMYGDYLDFDLPRDDYKLCLTACAKDSKCKAFTFVKPGSQGDSARCWLKSNVTSASGSSCCVTGVRRN